MQNQKEKAEKNIWDNHDLVDVIKNGGVAVMPTDTIYGMIGSAQNKTTVERIYQIRKRSPDKPCIILIGDVSELKNFSISLTENQQNILKKYWPGPYSLVFDCDDDTLEYLHRGTKTLAFRLPGKKELQEFLLKVGAVIAPSANTEKYPMSERIEDAENYFGDQVDLYVDGGPRIGKASQVIRITNTGVEDVLRA